MVRAAPSGKTNCIDIATRDAQNGRGHCPNTVRCNSAKLGQNCTTTADLLGARDLDRLITGADGVRGVTGFRVHPKLEDKARLGDGVANGAQGGMAVRTRAWVQSLGPIEPPAEAAKRKAAAVQELRALRLSAKAERAAQAAAQAPAPAPVINNINITINNTNHNHLCMDEESVKRRRLGDISGFFKKLS
jgi:hypothetical protein